MDVSFYFGYYFGILCFVLSFQVVEVSEGQSVCVMSCPRYFSEHNITLKLVLQHIFNVYV